MKIRVGFVTNSSSTNFLIISKKELTQEYLFRKLGGTKRSSLYSNIMEMVNDIFSGIARGPRYYDADEITYDLVLKIFGEKSAEKYNVLSKNGYHTYIGCINSDDSCLAAFMTVDHFIIDDKDFYMNGESCVW